jgi:hypothetical protein
MLMMSVREVGVLVTHTNMSVAMRVRLSWRV